MGGQTVEPGSFRGFFPTVPRCLVTEIIPSAPGLGNYLFCSGRDGIVPNIHSI